jgi:hypothetical protein
MRPLAPLLELTVLLANVRFDRKINVFAGSNAAWDLYILSLRQLRQTNQSDYPFILQITSNSPRLTGPLCHNSGSRANAIDIP